MTSLITTKLSFFFLVIFSSISYCQNPITYEEVVYLDSTISDKVLFERGEYWIVNSFENPDKVIQLIDRDAKKIICKSNFKYNSPFFMGSDNTKGVISHTIELYFKDGRYKYVLGNFAHESFEGPKSSFGLITDSKEGPKKWLYSTQKLRNKYWNDFQSKIESYSSAFILLLKEGMTTKLELESDDW